MWDFHHRSTQHLRIEYAGACAAAGRPLMTTGRHPRFVVGAVGTPSEAALMAAGKHPGLVGGVVGRSWEPDLSNISLSHVQNPTLLIVGGRDAASARLNRGALALIGAQEKDLEIVPGATHLFEEPGAL